MGANAKGTLQRPPRDRGRDQLTTQMGPFAGRGVLAFALSPAVSAGQYAAVRAAPRAARLRGRNARRDGVGALGAATARHGGGRSSALDRQFEHNGRVEGRGGRVGPVLFGRPPFDSAGGHALARYCRTGTTSTLVSAFWEIAAAVPGNGNARAHPQEESPVEGGGDGRASGCHSESENQG